MKIWLDVDGVISDFQKNVIQVANSIWPNKLPENYVPGDWDYSDVFTKAEWNAVWDEIHKIPDFWARQPAYPENVSALRIWLETSDDEIFFITSRMPTGGVDPTLQTKRWLDQNGLTRPKKWKNLPQVIAVAKSADKKSWVQKLEIQIGIDDLPSTVANLSTLPNHTCYLLDRPWNQNVGLPRVSSMQEFLERVENYRKSI